MSDDNRALSGRADLIQAIKTPLSFFVLAVLIIEVVMGSLAAFTSAADRTLMIWGMLILLGVTIAVVGTLAYAKPEVLQGRQPDLPFSLFIAAPVEFEGLDVVSIPWDKGACFLVGNGLREPVQLVPSLVAPTLRVHISQKIAHRISPNEPYHLDLRDTHGLRWRVANFYFFETVHPLIAVDGKQKVLAVYGEEEY
jgi:hypothetical protein